MKNRDKIEFFSEIYVEELPARLVNDLGLQLKNNFIKGLAEYNIEYLDCLLYTSPSPRDGLLSRMPSSA